MPRRIDNSLSAKQHRAIVALLNEPTMQRAAAVVGVSDRTLTRWMREPLFSAAFRRARREAFQHAMSLAQKYAPVALNTLAVISSDRGAPYASRVSASKAVLGFGRESIELDDLMQRVEEVELELWPAESGAAKAADLAEPPRDEAESDGSRGAAEGGRDEGRRSTRVPGGGPSADIAARAARLRLNRVHQRRADPSDFLFDGALDEGE